MKLREQLAYWSDGIMPEDEINKYLDCEVVKEFGMSFKKPWISWQEFGKHKNVNVWWLLDNGYAVALNENPSIGWSFPVKKLTKQTQQKALNHTATYEQYHNIQTEE